MSSLLLLRHGQASFGNADYDRLSALGERQASKTGLHLARTGIRFDEALVGPKRRHSATASAVLGQFSNAPTPTTVPSLDEFAEGSEVLHAAHHMSGLTCDEMAALPKAVQLRYYDALIEAWTKGHVDINGRPSVAAFRTDVARWLREVVTRPTRSQRLLAVTSAGVIAAAVTEVLDLPVAAMLQFTRVVRNASLTEVVFSAGRVSLLSFNGVAHLPPALISSV